MRGGNPGLLSVKCVEFVCPAKSFLVCTKRGMDGEHLESREYFGKSSSQAAPRVKRTFQIRFNLHS